jgi:signal transduction histidine kinase
LSAAEVRARPLELGALAAILSALDAHAMPILVVRLPELERIAWRRGLGSARRIERRASRAFAHAVARVLRAEDLAAHDPGSDVFVAVLLAPTRDGDAVPAPIDARSALARIAATLESTLRLDVRSGWTTYEPSSDRDAIAGAIERALARGAQERERYAFFSALGHELRTPLSSIRGYLETLLDDDVDEATRSRFVRIAYNEAMRLSRLVEGMFEISLLDLHATFPARASCSLAIALDAARDACAATAAARGVTVSIDAAAPGSVAIDGDRLTLILINLVDNAIKHGRPGGRVRITVETPGSRFARLRVDDDGSGIPPADRERIFALGERGTTRADGSGIGLALVRLMLERIGGRVEVGDSPLGGARFAVTIPRG